MNSSNTSLEQRHLRQLTQQHIDNWQWDAAQAALESLVQQVPGDAVVQMQLADVMLRRGRLRESSALMLCLATRLPRDAMLIIGLVQRLVALGEILTARACLDLLAQAPDAPPEMLVAQAHLRFSIGEVATAKLLMEGVMAAGIDSPGEQQLYAMLLQFNGDIDGAATVLEKCLKRWPHFGDAVMALVNLRKQTLETPLLHAVQDQLGHMDHASKDPGTRFVCAEFEYAQFKILDDLERHVEAWPALERCNAIMRELNPYDAASEEAVTDALMHMPELKNAAAVSHAAKPAGATPIFIVGMPRSGTTLLDRMLSAHSQVISAGEIMDFGCQLRWAADVAQGGAQGLQEIIQHSGSIDYAELGARYLKQTQWRAQGYAYYIDKLPANIQLVAFIRMALPHAPILHLVRDPLDTCFSNFKAMFGNVSPYSYDQRALAHYYGQYARLSRQWQTQFPGVMLDVPYASLVSEPEIMLRQVLTHCGLEFEDGCLRPELNAAPVATPSSIQVRESVHTRSLGQWQKYAKQLEPLRMALAEYLR